MSIAVGFGCIATDTRSPEGASAYMKLLGTIPHQPEAGNSVYIHDYSRVRTTFDLPHFHLPGPNDNDDALKKFAEQSRSSAFWRRDRNRPIEMLGIGLSYFFGPFVLEADTPVASFNVRPYFAFDIRNIDQAIAVQTMGNREHLQTVRGRFDPDAAGKESGSVCLPSSRKEHKGVSYYLWGEDNEPDKGTGLAPPGSDGCRLVGRTAVLDEYVFHTLTSDGMKSLIDAHLGETPSLANVAEFRELANGMSQLEAYTMYLTDNVAPFGLAEVAKDTRWENTTKGAKEKFVAAWSGPGLLRPYQAFAVGGAMDAAGPYTTLVLVHADGRSAEENTTLLRRRIAEGINLKFGSPWADEFDIDASEIVAEGRLLLAKLRGHYLRDPTAWIWERDNLIAYE